MDIIRIVLLALCGMIAAVMLKGYKQEYSIFIIMAISLLFLFWGMNTFGEIKLRLEGISSFYSDNRYYYRILFKIIGITYLCEFTSGMCKDAGYQSIGIQVELLGKLIILLSGLPVLLAIIETVAGYKI